MDNITPKERSQIMARVKSRGNISTEIKLLSIFKARGVKGWRRGFPLLGSPDIVFPKLRLVLFVDGCFWHGCKNHCRLPKSNKKYWIGKINRNKKRDRYINRELRKRNWTVIRIWEHELRKQKYTKKLNQIRRILNMF